MTANRAVRRLWRPRAIASVAIPLVLALVVAAADQPISDHIIDASARRAVHYALVFVAALLALSAVRAFGDALSGALDDYLGIGRARSLATVVSVVLYVIVILTAVDASGLNLSGLLVGGALTGVVVGIAGQASLSNIIAGLVLLFARPYTVGTYITVRAGVFGGVEYSGQVWDVALFHTTIRNDEQQIRIPNSVMIGAVVVLRPEEIAVSLPVTLQRVATPDLAASIERLRRAIEECVPRSRSARVALENVTVDGYVVGVRVFVANEHERQAIERAVATALAVDAPDQDASLSESTLEQGDKSDAADGEARAPRVGARS